MSRKKKGKLRQTADSTGSGGKVEDGNDASPQALEGAAGTARPVDSAPVPAPAVLNAGPAPERFRPIHGNFRNYYAIRGRSNSKAPIPSTDSGGGSANQADAASKALWTAAASAVVPTRARDDIDARLRQFLNWTVTKYSAILPFARILDIGCNSGLVTLQIGQTLEYIYSRSPECVLGVDIDAELIKEAREALAVAQQIEPARKRRRLDGIALPIPVQQHSISLFQPRRLKTKAAAGSTRTAPEARPSSQPENAATAAITSGDVLTRTAFESADWVNEKSSTACQWDLILGLSLTKWVHINSGTRGIFRLFGRIASELSQHCHPASASPASGGADGGVFLLEPQAWSSYQTARSQGADVRARLRALQSPATHFIVDDATAGTVSKETHFEVSQSGRKSKKRKRRDRDDEGGGSIEKAQLNGSSKLSPATDSVHWFPPVSPDDFPFLLSTVFGLEGPIEIGHAQGAGFLRPLQAYAHHIPSVDNVGPSESVLYARKAALDGTLFLPWVPRQFR